ncbi:MAG: phosphoglucosamine mutase [Eubacteriales bacterium]|nr:phosphoglucosamine mutase [Eubacteriales bacterium]MDD4285505.1 phosphoglucosamine mutase [Eubacteriales bacterium]HPF18097.1 phosphoglucosamine mutase [Bacillota bacterium]
MGRLFGTDGVRGIANSELTANLAFKLGKAGAYVLSKEDERPVVLIGKDTRISGDMLEDALSSGVLSMGGNVIKVGVLPTPAIAYLVRYFHADAGVVISASHNTFEHNGIKFFNSEGFKLDDDLEEEIEDIITRDLDVSSHITGAQLGRMVEQKNDALALYAEFLAQTISVDIRGMEIAVDCANGAASLVAEKVFSALGAKLHIIHNRPDGININHNCGSTHPEDLQETVRKTGASVGLAFDGDADRLIAVDEKGDVVDGDRTMYICAKMLKETDALPFDLVTTTVMSNIGFHKAVEALGLKAEVTQVGDRYVLERMIKTGCVIGGEQSGHIIFRNHTTTGDGILSALQLLQAMKLANKPLSELAAEVVLYPQVLKNAKVRNENKKRLEKDKDILEAIREVEEKLHGEGRVLIRPSGTEPLVRVMIEGKKQDEITLLAENLAQLITRNLG